MSVTINEDSIYKNDNLVMHRDVTLYENSCADLVAINGGIILEVGFGLGLSADIIQTHNPD